MKARRIATVLILSSIGCASAQTIPEEAPDTAVEAVRLPLSLPGQLKPMAVVATGKKATLSAAREVTAANRAARIEPAKEGFVNAVQVWPYSAGALYQLYASPGRVTDIALQPGERLVSVSAGDTVRWIIGDTVSGSGAEERVHVLVKPVRADLRTNLIISTDRRSYHLELSATPQTWMASLSWQYPDELVRTSAREPSAAVPVADGIGLERLRFGYAIGGDTPTWRPLRAFDDGRKVYVQFPANIVQGELPPLFVIGAHGDAQLVNYRVRLPYLIVDRLFDAAELRLGGKRQQVVRIERDDAADVRRR